MEAGFKSYDHLDFPDEVSSCLQCVTFDSLISVSVTMIVIIAVVVFVIMIVIFSIVYFFRRSQQPFIFRRKPPALPFYSPMPRPSGFPLRLKPG